MITSPGWLLFLVPVLATAQPRRYGSFRSVTQSVYGFVPLRPAQKLRGTALSAPLEFRPRINSTLVVNWPQAVVPSLIGLRRSVALPKLRQRNAQSAFL